MSRRLLRSAALPLGTLGLRLSLNPPKRKETNSGQTHRPPHQQLIGRNRFAADTLAGFGACLQTSAYPTSSFPPPTEVDRRPPTRRPRSHRLDRSRASANKVGSSTATGSHASEITRGCCRSDTTGVGAEARSPARMLGQARIFAHGPKGHDPTSAARRRRSRANHPRIDGAAPPPRRSQQASLFNARPPG